MSTRRASDLGAKVADARRRLEHTKRLGASRVSEPDATVQLSVRVPARLRNQVHEVAAAMGMSTQAWLSLAVSEAVERVVTPEGRAAAVLVEEARRHLGQALADGSYERLVASMPDPELG